jgi:hypothetical protein
MTDSATAWKGHIEVFESQQEGGESQCITARILDLFPDSREEEVRDALTFQNFSEAKSWIDKDWASIGLDECWNELYLTRRVDEGDDTEQVMFRMELIKPANCDAPFHVHDPKNQPRLVAFQCNKDGSKQILTFGMAFGVREIDRKAVHKVWPMLFKEELTFDDLYQLFEFGPEGA